MPVKYTIIAVGVGFIVINVCAAILLITWPDIGPHAALEHEQSYVEAGTILSDSTVQAALVSEEVLRGKQFEIQTENATESAATEVDKSVLPVYTEDTVLSAKNTKQRIDRVQVPVYGEGTVLEVMRAEQEKGSLTFEGTNYPGLGVFVETVQGVLPPKGNYWILYINGAPATLGISYAIVQVGDVVEWRLEKDIYQ
ncbi:MAG: DUF4430 domain-containing protein [Candidatus Pacebacteria bacterium]|nr:DUF4430 domain-containing protein [Candidatus Paceibacterota bacterium]